MVILQTQTTRIHRCLQGTSDPVLLGHKGNEKSLYQQFTAKHLTSFQNFLYLSNQEYNWTQWGVKNFFKVIRNKIIQISLRRLQYHFSCFIRLKTLPHRRVFSCFFFLSSLLVYFSIIIVCHPTHFSDGKTKVENNLSCALKHQWDLSHCEK